MYRYVLTAQDLLTIQINPIWTVGGKIVPPELIFYPLRMMGNGYPLYELCQNLKFLVPIM